MSDIFISYSQKDRQKVRLIARALEVYGWSVFWDIKIRGGQTWPRVIGQELDKARCVIAVWSRNSIDSEWVLEEAERGKKKQILIPVTLENVSPPFGFGRIQVENLEHWDGGHKAPQFQDVIHAIVEILGEESPATIKAREEEKKVREADAKRIAEEEAKLIAEEEERMKEEALAKQKAEKQQRMEAETKRNAEEEKQLKEEVESEQKTKEEFELKKKQEAIVKSVEAKQKQSKSPVNENVTPENVTHNNVTWLKIGNQIWMAKNLDVSTHRNGDPIPEVKDPEAWAKLTTGAWCYYDNDPVKGKIYGKLYNWYAVNDPRGLAPEGWHIPTDNEWSELTLNMGGNEIAGGKLKQIRPKLWKRPNKGATNSSGFTALPGGYRRYDGIVSDIGRRGYWWSANEQDEYYAWNWNLLNSVSKISRAPSGKQLGFSVRCVMD